MQLKHQINKQCVILLLKDVNISPFLLHWRPSCFILNGGIKPSVQQKSKGRARQCLSRIKKEGEKKRMKDNFFIPVLE